MKTKLLFPCSSTGKILKGFCPTIFDSDKDLTETLFGYIKFSQKFGIKYYSYDGKIIKLL